VPDVSPTSQTETGKSVAIYTRVSAAENKGNLDTQAQRLLDYCAAKGYQVGQEVKDRLTRFGFNYIEQLLAMQGRHVEVINLAENGKEDLVQDFVSIVTSFCSRLYRQRRSKRKTERIIAELQKDEEE
jgi:putative resolvase